MCFQNRPRTDTPTWYRVGARGAGGGTEEQTRQIPGFPSIIIIIPGFRDSITGSHDGIMQHDVGGSNDGDCVDFLRTAAFYMPGGDELAHKDLEVRCISVA